MVCVLIINVIVIKDILALIVIKVSGLDKHSLRIVSKKMMINNKNKKRKKKRKKMIKV